MNNISEKFKIFNKNGEEFLKKKKCGLLWNLFSYSELYWDFVLLWLFWLVNACKKWKYLSVQLRRLKCHLPGDPYVRKEGHIYIWLTKTRWFWGNGWILKNMPFLGMQRQYVSEQNSLSWRVLQQHNKTMISKQRKDGIGKYKFRYSKRA